MADDKEIEMMERYFRAANYLSVGQIYLLDNPLLEEPLKVEHVKPRLLGHWGTTPGLNFIYVHLNRVIKKHDLDMIYICGPGHGGPGMVANTYIEGSYSEIYPSFRFDKDGLRQLFKQFSFPGGIPSHVAPETPGSIHEGGELGYALSHAYGAAFDNPGLIVSCVIGDGESETGPLSCAWPAVKFLHPTKDGAVLPIWHLNGFKIANPCVWARTSDKDIESYLTGCGWGPVIFVNVGDGKDHIAAHRAMAAALEQAVGEIRAQKRPVIVLRSPKGWTGPEAIDGKKCEGSWRSHQVPIAEVTKPSNLAALDAWLKSYAPAELFDANGAVLPEIRALAPTGNRRMGMNPHTNGGLLLKDLVMPDWRSFCVEVKQPGTQEVESVTVAGKFLREVMRANMSSKNFRVFGPDETASNRLQAIFECTKRSWQLPVDKDDTDLDADGRVVEILSEHMCQGWLEGYLLTGRHGLFSCYEAFIHLVDSMFNQHAKWLKTTSHIPWRRPISSLNYILTSHVWRQDHNGFSHQDPGFLDHVVNKKGQVIRIYLPPDANCLLSTVDHCLRSRNYVNVIVAGKQPALQYLDMQSAAAHCSKGIGIWSWASSDQGCEPDVVMACCGDVPTLETLAAVDIMRQHFPALKVRVINVFDLMMLQPPAEHPHGMADREFDCLFTKDKPVVFCFHGYPWLIHRLTYRRAMHSNLHVRGYKEEGTTTTPFDMCVLNEIDRFHLVIDVIERVPGLMIKGGHVKEMLKDKLVLHKEYINRVGHDMPEIRTWRWPYSSK